MSLEEPRFQGRHEHTLDEKNRLVLPKGLREDSTEQGTKFNLVMGREGRFLEVFPMDVWVAHINRQRAMFRPGRPDVEEYFRDLFASVHPVKLDKSFRFIVPEELLEDAEIGKEVVIIGSWDHMEIWDREAWRQRAKSRKGKLSMPLPDVSDGGRPELGPHA